MPRTGLRMLLSLTLFVWSAISVAAATPPPMTRDDARSRFAAGNQAYKDGNYAGAQASYQQVVDAGWESGPLYYNLANAAYKQGQTGKALVYYARARQIWPRDADLAANANYVRSQVPALASESPSWLRRLWDGHLNFYTMDEMALILLGLAGLGLGLHAVSLYGGWPRRRVRAALIVIGLVFAGYLCGILGKIGATRGWAIAVADTAARFEPRDGATVHFEVPEGQRLRRQKSDGEWVRVERSDGQVGWVPGKDLLEI